MIILNAIEKFIRVINKLEFEKYAKRKLPTTTVLGKIYCENGTLEIGENVIIYPGVMFSGNGKIVIGNNVKIGKDVILYANKNGGIEIGDNTIIAAQSYIIDSNHSIAKGELISRQKLDSQRIVIGKDVWIGADCTVVKGSSILNGAVIGAKSLVNSTIEENNIAFGVPARHYKNRE